MNVELNGERVELADGASVADAVAAAGADSGRRGVAVAVDGEVVPRSGWQATRLTDGQKVEVVEAIQGGTAPATYSAPARSRPNTTGKFASELAAFCLTLARSRLRRRGVGGQDEV